MTFNETFFTSIGFKCIISIENTINKMFKRIHTGRVVLEPGFRITVPLRFSKIFCTFDAKNYRTTYSGIFYVQKLWNQ